MRRPGSCLLPLLLAWSALAAPALRCQTVRGQPALPEPEIPFFPILVWAQPRHLIDHWRQLGINTIVSGEALATEAERRGFLDRVGQAGMKGVLAVEDYTPALDRHPALLCWRLVDEPDLNPTHNGNTWVPRITPQDLANTIAALPPGRTRGLWLNTTVRFYGTYRQLDLSWYRAYYQLADLVGFDHYPVTGWNLPANVFELEPATAACVPLAPGKPVLPIVEASDQDLSWTPPQTRGPTAAEMRAEVWLSVVGGARGIGYFTIAFNPFRWDNVAPAVATELGRTNRQLQRLAPVLVFDPPAGVQVTSSAVDVRCAVRAQHGQLLVVAVNRSAQAATANLRLTLPGIQPKALQVVDEGRMVRLAGGAFSDTFPPLGVHLYAVGF